MFPVNPINPYLDRLKLMVFLLMQSIRRLVFGIQDIVQTILEVTFVG